MGVWEYGSRVWEMLVDDECPPQWVHLGPKEEFRVERRDMQREKGFQVLGFFFSHGLRA